jgi:hypothetical protein
MTKNTINQICDKLTTLADNFAEQERTLRGLIAVIRTAKDEDEPKVVNTLPEDKIGVIERLLKELLEKKEGKSSPFPGQFPFDTHPHISPKVGDQPGWWNNQPFCNPCNSTVYSDPSIFPNGSSFIGGSSITVTPCSNPSDQQIVYADSRGTHITGKEMK